MESPEPRDGWGMVEGVLQKTKTDWEVGMTFFNIDIFCINNILEIVVHP